VINRIIPAAFAVVALVFAAQPAAAQNPMTIGISGGVSLPLSDLSDTHETGWNVTGGIGFGMPASNLGFRFEGFYNSFNAETGSGDLRIAGGAVNALYNLSTGGIRLYVINGVGAYNQRVTGSASSTDFGINAGAGIKFALGALNTYVEARLHSVSGDPQRQFVPIVFGVEF